MGKSRLAFGTAVLAMLVGAGSFFGGVAGAVYTYNEAAQQNITVTDDASWNAGDAVTGPLDMLAQADVIEHHQLDRTDGKFYAEMDREDPARASWLTATTLTNALSLGVLAYGLAALAATFGLVIGLSGVVLFRSNRAV